MILYTSLAVHFNRIFKSKQSIELLSLTFCDAIFCTDALPQLLLVGTRTFLHSE